MFKSKKATQKIMAVICAIGLIVGESNVTVSKADQKPVSLSKTNLTLKVGKAKTIKVKKTKNTKIKKKTFTSSKKKVATITKNGKITAKKIGKTIIKVKVKYQKGKKTKTTTLKCTVKVTNNTTTNNSSTNSSTNPASPNQILPDNGSATETPIPTDSEQPVQTKTPAPTTSQKPQQTKTPLPTVSQEPSETPDVSFDITLPREAGLYDADGNMIKTWNELIAEGSLRTTDGVLVDPYETDITTGIETIRDNSDMVGNLIIPETIIGIQYYPAFGFNCGLTGIQIPSSITDIDHDAFYYCNKLERLAVTSGNTVYDSRMNCNAIIESETNTLIAGCKNTVIPNTVTAIGSYAFCGRNGLISIEIPDTVTSINSYAFHKCDNLKRIEIPDSVIWIGYNVFSSCDNLESITVTPGNTKYDSRENCNAIIHTETNTLDTGCKNTVIPNTVTSIGSSAFEGCTDLTSIIIPNSVTSIGYEAFSGCTNLCDIVIPDSVTSIDGGVFVECKSLTSIVIPASVTKIESASIESYGAFEGGYFESIVVEPGNTKYDSRENCNAIIDTETNTLLYGCKNTVIPNSVTTIGSYSFRGCQNLTSLTIPNSITSIEDAAFRSCSNLTSAKMSDSLTNIGYQSFAECSNLTNIKIPDSVTRIGSRAFSECNLTSIEIPGNVISIGYSAFSGNNLDSISVAAENTKYDSRDNCNAVINTKENTLEIGCKNTIIPNTVTSIGQGAFYCCTNLTNITIPDNIISIKSNAFSGCSNLASIIIPSSVTQIDSYAFSGCSNLTNIVIPNSVTHIGENAFNHVPLVIYDGDLPVEDWSANQVQKSDGTVIYPIP